MAVRRKPLSASVLKTLRAKAKKSKLFKKRTRCFFGCGKQTQDTDECLGDGKGQQTDFKRKVWNV